MVLAFHVAKPEDMRPVLGDRDHDQCPGDLAIIPGLDFIRQPTEPSNYIIQAWAPS